MSSAQPPEVAATTAEAAAAPTLLPGLSLGNEPATHEPLDQWQLLPEQSREVVRLIQCPVCSCPLRDPFTLPCGGTLCRACLPSPHLRTHISYPATANRLQGLQCPFPECGREHAFGDCSPDVTLSKALASVASALETARNSASAAKLVTHVVVKDQWQEAGVPTLRDVETTSKLIPGGRLLATFALAQGEQLNYNAEVAYMSPATESQATFDTTVLEEVKEAARAEMDCQVCYALFYDPVTTPCGHTFCRSCLQRVLDHARYCPICRRNLSMDPMVHRDACASNKLITKIITSFWADMLESRRQAINAEDLQVGNSEYDIAIFVCTLSFPSMPTFLHVFEPRYRLMIRRALEGNRTFGMVMYHPRGFAELGTVLRIVNAEFFPDGRSLIETVGVSRFRVVEHSTLDGYIVAKIQNINDISIAEEEEREVAETRNRPMRHTATTPVAGTSGSNAAPSQASHEEGPTEKYLLASREEIETTPTSELMAFGADFVQRMRAQSVGWLTARMLAIYGECPLDPAVFPWWFANILPVKESEKYRLLSTTSVRERLKICCGWILEWERSTWSFSSCIVS